MSDESVDRELVDELREVMGEGFTALVDSFRADGETRLEALRQHLAEGDAEALRQQAHSFKGSSGNVGAREVAGLCLELEEQAQQGALDGAGDTLSQIEQAMQDYLSTV